jgi:hypothetical protein
VESWGTIVRIGRGFVRNWGQGYEGEESSVCKGVYMAWLEMAVMYRNRR